MPVWWTKLSPWDRTCAKVNAAMAVLFVLQALVEWWAQAR